MAARATNAALFNFPLGMRLEFDEDSLPLLVVTSQMTIGDSTTTVQPDSVAKIFTYTRTRENVVYPDCTPTAMTVDWTQAVTNPALTELLFGTALRDVADPLHLNFTVSERAQYDSLMAVDYNFDVTNGITEAEHLQLAGFTLFHCVTAAELGNFMRTKRILTTDGNF